MRRPAPWRGRGRGCRRSRPRPASGQVEQVTRVPGVGRRAGAVTRTRQGDDLLGRGWTCLKAPPFGSPSGRARRPARAAGTRPCRSGSRRRGSARRPLPSSRSRSRWPSTSHTTSSGCSATVRADHRCFAIPYAWAGPSSSTAMMRWQRRRCSAKRRRTRAAVVGDRVAVTGQQQTERHRRRALEAGQVLDPRLRTRSGRLGDRHDLGVRRDAGEQVIADEGGGAALVDEQRVGRAVARASQRSGVRARPRR